MFNITEVFNKIKDNFIQEKTEFEQTVNSTKKLYGMDTVKAIETVVQEELMFSQYNNDM